MLIGAPRSPPTVWSVTDPTLGSSSDRHQRSATTHGPPAPGRRQLDSDGLLAGDELTAQSRAAPLPRCRPRCQSPGWWSTRSRGTRPAPGTGGRPHRACSICSSAAPVVPMGKNSSGSVSRHSASERQPYSALARAITLAGRDIAHRLRFRSRGWGPCEMVHMPVPTATTCTRQGPAQRRRPATALTRGLAKDVRPETTVGGDIRHRPSGGFQSRAGEHRGGVPSGGLDGRRHGRAGRSPQRRRSPRRPPRCRPAGRPGGRQHRVR